ncbi:MAG: hypothetical protein KC944_22705 [Candidatus Omnitrophica bacterium]|nr:hypothetical protein [Candidatus Omnitrophota bacterium]
MSLFTSSSKFKESAKPLALFLGVQAIACTLVLLVPWTGAGWFQDLIVEQVDGDSRDVVIMGDSKVFPFVDGRIDCPFFEQPAYAFAWDSSTVLYHRILYDRLIHETSLRPRVVFYSLGANNFAEEGLHVQRDYAIRFVARPKDLIGYTGMKGSLPFLADAFFSRLYPIYGRRIEITHLMFRGYKMREIDLSPPERDLIADQNYLLIYQRGFFSNYKVSEFHMENLKRFSEEVRASGAELILLDLPVTQEMRDLEKEFAQEWDDRIQRFSEDNQVRYLDLRDHPEMLFRDINHLSNISAKEVSERWLQPLVDEGLGQ